MSIRVKHSRAKRSEMKRQRPLPAALMIFIFFLLPFEVQQSGRTHRADLAPDRHKSFTKATFKIRKMTCTFAIFDGQTIIMASDSAGTTEDGSIESQKNSKMFKMTILRSDGPVEILVGFAGCFRAPQIIRHMFQVPEWSSGTPESYLVSKFVPEAAKLLAKNDIGNKENPFGTCNLLLAFDGHIFIVETNGQILESASRYSAIGSGADVALGAAHALSGSNEPSWIIAEKALYAAEAFKSTVRRPFHMEYIMH